MLSIQDSLNSINSSNGLTNQDAINSIARTSGLTQKEAFNIWAGTTNLSKQDAVNIKAGTQNLLIQDALNTLVDGNGFNPSLVEGAALEVYFDARFMVYNTGTTPATDGQAVTTWGDRSQSSNDLTQGTGVRQPAYRATGGPNSLPCVEFDGSSDVMASLNGVTGDQKTVFLVMNKTAAGTGYQTIVRMPSVQLLANLTTGGNKFGAWEGAEVVSSSTISTTFGVYGFVQRNFNDVDFRVNGTPENETNGISFPGTGTNSIYLGGNSDTTQFVASKVSALLVYDGILSEEENLYVERGLGTIWGITVA